MSDTLDSLRREAEADERFRAGPLAELGRHVVAFGALRQHLEALCEMQEAANQVRCLSGASEEECQAALAAWPGSVIELRNGLAAGRLRIVDGEVVEHHQPESTFDDLFDVTLRLMPWWRRPFARLSRAWWRMWHRLRVANPP